jgi:arylsulfatase A-like enzyme
MRFAPYRFLSTILATTLASVLPHSSGAAAEPASHGVAEHVVVVVWDGMRPDFITRDYTPNLFALAAGGVFFTNHHPVFVSSTEVNGTAIATGDYPRHSKIIANTEYLPEIDNQSIVGTEKPGPVKKGDEITHGHYLGASTMAEILQNAGFPTVVAGTKGVALLLDRAEIRPTGAAAQSVDLRVGRTYPSQALAPIVYELGRSFPTNTTYPNVEADAWTTEALTRALWKNGVPKLSMLWMSDPDYTQHRNGPGSPQALQALASVDHNLGNVLAALEQKGVRGKTDIFVVSDHGFSTVEKSVDMPAVLRKNGFKAARQPKGAAPDTIIVDGLGGSVMFYVLNHDRALVQKLVDFLQTYELSSVIATKDGLKGTFSMAQLGLDADVLLPDVLLGLKWSHEQSKNGTPGMIYSEGSMSPGQGNHASFSRFDMHNTLIGNGPDLKAGFVDTLPTGNADVAPTVLWILGVQPDSKRDGRVLREALTAFGHERPKVTTRTEKASRRFEEHDWKQEMKVSHVGESFYIDEASGGTVR